MHQLCDVLPLFGRGLMTQYYVLREQRLPGTGRGHEALEQHTEEVPHRPEC